MCAEKETKNDKIKKHDEYGWIKLMHAVYVCVCVVLVNMRWLSALFYRMATVFV